MSAMEHILVTPRVRILNHRMEKRRKKKEGGGRGKKNSLHAGNSTLERIEVG